MYKRVFVCLVSTAVMAFSVAYAQQKSAPKGKVDVGASDDLTEIVVTGSRIRRASLDALEPAQVITAEYLEQRGLTNVADALNELVSYGQGITPEGGQASFGTGVNFVNRFSLGSARTLTLVNGRRFVSSNPPTLFGPAGPGLQVDLNAIPTILIDRVESIAVGGAPTYGSDAIAGTVNVILKERFEGVRLFGQGGQTFKNGGDAQNFSMGIVAGTNVLDNSGNISFSFQHSKQAGLLAQDRPRFAASYFLATNPSATAVSLAQPTRAAATDGRVNTGIPFNTGSSDGISNSVYIANRRIGLLTRGGLVLPASLAFDATQKILGFGANRDVYLQFNKQGELVPYNTGVNFGQVDYSGGDGLNLVDATQITSDLKRDVVNLFANFDLGDRAKIFFEGTGYKGSALELTDQWAYQSALFGGQSGSVLIPSTHPLLTAQARATLNSLGITSFRVERAHTDLATNNGRGDTDLLRGVIGFRGDFALADRKFNWEVSANYGRSKATSYSNQLNYQKFINALNATVNSAGAVVCNPNGTIRIAGVGPIADSACVPIDVFGEGRPSTAAKAYVASIESVESELKQRVFNANVGGDLVDLWAGPISVNVGYEQRKEEGSFVPNDYLSAGLGRSTAITATGGSFETKESFGEFIFPLVSPQNDLAAVHRLNLVGKIRYVDNTVNGGFTTSTLGIQYQPIQGLEIRGNVTKSLRAPSIVELYLPKSGLFSFINHPCDSRAITGPGTTRAANCESFFKQYGITSPFTFTAWSASTLGTTSGNSSLLNERAKSWTAGLVYRPSFVEGLQLSADYLDIQISDVITSLTATQLAVACFDSPSYPNNPFCGRLQYTSTGQSAGFQAGYVNGNALAVAGFIANADYGFELSKIGFGENSGQARLRFDWYHEGSSYQVTATGARTDYAGTIGEPKDQINLGLSYQKGRIGLSWQTQYTPSVRYNKTDTIENSDILSVGAYYLNNASVSVGFGKSTIVRLALTNVFDKDPPFPTSGSRNYDILGRRFSLSFTHDF